MPYENFSCPECGCELGSRERFCPDCGVNLSNYGRLPKKLFYYKFECWVCKREGGIRTGDVQHEKDSRGVVRFYRIRRCIHCGASKKVKDTDV